MANYKFQQKPLAFRDFRGRFPARFACDTCGNTQAGLQVARSPGADRSFKPEGGALTDLMQRSEVVAAFLDLEPARAYRDLECFDVEEPIREIIEVEVCRMSLDKT